MKRILYAKPSITDLEIAYVNDAVQNGWGDRCYDYLRRFERSFAERMDVRSALATSSCTGALHLAYAALGVGPGDEVIVPELTWIASVAPVIYLGAKCVFVDTLKDSWCVDPAGIEQAITPRTKAILAVHLYGNLADMDAILNLARRYNLKVVEDAAEGIGSIYRGRYAGTLGDLGVYSFHGTKTMTTGEGGMLVSNNEEILAKAGILADHGRAPHSGRYFWPDVIGYKYKMSNLQAALGCAQLERATQLIEKKRTVFRWYREAASHMDGLRWNPEPEYTRNSYWMPTFVIDQACPVERDEVIRRLAERGIQARPFFYPLSMLPMFERCAEHIVSYRTAASGVNLPNYFEMTQEDAVYVIESLEEIICK